MLEVPSINSIYQKALMVNQFFLRLQEGSGIFRTTAHVWGAFSLYGNTDGNARDSGHKNYGFMEFPTYARLELNGGSR